jgi:hypothetical protein
LQQDLKKAVSKEDNDEVLKPEEVKGEEYAD